MDKFLVRRAVRHSSSSSSFSSSPSPRQHDADSKRQPKRAKTEDTGAAYIEKESRSQKLESSTSDDQSSRKRSLAEDDEESGGDGDSALVANGYDGFPFEEPLASFESLDEVIDSEPEMDGAGPLYRSSIYVDAFNIALDTVLEQEAHLFNEKEKAVFETWRHLDYEAQYLSLTLRGYVRLFLRKQAAWHRTQRLGYQSDIGNLQGAIESLQQPRDLPQGCEVDEEERTARSGSVPQELTLGSSFAFAQSFDEANTTVDEAIQLLSLDELKLMAKQMKAVGKTKADLQTAIVHMATRQLTLLSAGLRRPDSVSTATTGNAVPELRRRSTISERGDQLVAKITAITGPCIRICPSVFKLFERVHLVFYRTSEWTEKSLTTIVLAKMSKRNFPDYVVSRTANIFECRQQLLDFEAALRLQHKVDQILGFDGPAGEDGFKEVIALFNSIASQWRALLQEEQLRQDAMLDCDDYSYLRRFKASHVFTRVAHYAAHCFGRLHEYREEYALLEELLNQRLLHLARRGAWYQRKALLEERYMAVAEPDHRYKDDDQQKRHWWRKALETCETALQDRDCHLIYHHDLQKRIMKLEKRLRIPRRLQHDFGHLRLRAPEEHAVEGVQVKREQGEPLKKDSSYVIERTVWLDTLSEDKSECSVEEMCLNDYRSKGWKGYHSEGGIIRTLFAYLFYDILFLYIPNVFQTAYQTCPLDLHTDVFYAARASEINRRLVEIANGEAPRIVREVHAAHFERRTCIVGLKWDFELEDVAELAHCFNGDALALVCKVLAQEYRQRVGGLPDLLLWRMDPTPEVLFSEVKSANDRLSDTQRMWIHVLAGAGVRVAVCHAVAKQVKVR